MKKKSKDKKNFPLVGQAILGKSGLKQTAFRLVLIEFFLKKNRPLTGLQVFEGLKKAMSLPAIRFDRATVFRNLKTLVAKEVLQSTEFGTGSHHFYLRSSRHHHHVFCVRCEMAEPINFCGVAPMIERANQIGYSVLSHRLDLLGLCPACR